MEGPLLDKGATLWYNTQYTNSGTRRRDRIFGDTFECSNNSNIRIFRQMFEIDLFEMFDYSVLFETNIRYSILFDSCSIFASGTLESVRNVRFRAHKISRIIYTTPALPGFIDGTVVVYILFYGT